MATDTKVKELVINKLTKKQFDSIIRKNDNELYLIEDDDTFALKAETYTQTAVDNFLKGKQDTLVNETNIKSINGNTLLGAGSLSVTDMYDATVLYNAVGSTLQDPDKSNLLAAVDAKKALYIYDTKDDPIKVMLRVIYVNHNAEDYTFVVFNGTTSFKLLLKKSTGAVSIDSETIGATFNLYNNTASVNVFNLTSGSSIEDIKTAFTNFRGDKVIPETGDVFYINSNSNGDIPTSGVVFAKTEDTTGISIYIQSNNLVEGFLSVHHLKMTYTASVGIDSLKVVSNTETTIDPELVSYTKMEALTGKVEKGEKENNEFNISLINSASYTLQEAISALAAHLGDRPKFVGLKLTYADKTNNQPYTYVYKGGSFVNVSSWKLESIYDAPSDSLSYSRNNGEWQNLGMKSVWTGTQSQYDQIPVKDDTIIYFIK